MSVILETPRLALRQFCEDDGEALFLLNADAAVIQYTGDVPFENVELAKNFVRHYSHYKDYGFGRWAVILKTDETCIGWCGLKHVPEKNETDVGFRFFKQHWNKGYATEAAMACITYGFNTLNLQQIVGRAMKANRSSVRVLEKAGMTYIKDIDFDGQPGVVYSISNKNIVYR